MNAEITWLQWQALGNDVPIEVCELLAELMPHFDNCDLAVKDNGWRELCANRTNRTTVWIVMEGSVMPLDEEGVTRLALFCWRLHSVNDAGSARFALCEAAKGWWHPIVRRTNWRPLA